MAGKVKVTLLKPLDGKASGESAEYLEADVKRLEERGAVKRAATPKNKKAPAAKNKSKGDS